MTSSESSHNNRILFYSPQCICIVLYLYYRTILRLLSLQNTSYTAIQTDVDCWAVYRPMTDQKRVFLHRVVLPVMTRRPRMLGSISDVGWARRVTSRHVVWRHHRVTSDSRGCSRGVMLDLYAVLSGCCPRAPPHRWPFVIVMGQ